MARADGWAAHVARVAPCYQLVWRSRIEAEFHAGVEAAIEEALRRIETARASFRLLDEVGLSNLTAQLLYPLVPASPEKNRNGHVDLVIEHPQGLPWVYLVECKIWDGHKRHKGAMLQLLGYATSFDKRGMCLAFFLDHHRMAFLLQRERQDVQADPDVPVLDVCTDHPSIREAFVSLHQHQTGTRFQIVHVGCDLFVA